DRLVRHVGHAAFPWSALLPLAVGRALAGPVRGGRATSAASPRDATAAALRVHAAAGLAASLLAGTAVAPWAGGLPWLGVAPLAVAVAIAVDDLSAGAKIGLTPALVVLALAAVLGLDLVRDPARALAAWSIPDVAFPV